MSGGFGYYDGDIYDGQDPSDGLGAQQAAQQNKGNPLRDHLKKVEDQNNALQAQLGELLKKQRATEVADALQAKGYDRGIAGLYGGDPAKLDEWLTQVSPFLAVKPSDTSGQGGMQGQGAGAVSTVPAEGQAALQQMQGMGQNAAAPQGSEAEQIAQMRSLQSPEALQDYLRTQGNPYHFNG